MAQWQRKYLMAPEINLDLDLVAARKKFFNTIATPRDGAHREL